MGFASFLEKIGSVFTHKKGGSADQTAAKINGTVEQLVNHGGLVTSEGVIVGVTEEMANPMENEKLERMANSFAMSPEKKQFIEFLLSAINSKNEGFLRNTFLDYADHVWGEDSIKQSISKWPTVINDFMSLGQDMANETNPVRIMKKFQISKEESDFLSKKQAIYKRWKDRLKDSLKGRLSGKK